MDAKRDPRFKVDEYVCRLSPELKKLAKDELGEEDTNRSQALSEFRKWIQSNKELENCRLDSNFLLRFLRAKKFDLKLSQETLINYLTTRATFPEWYQCLDCQDEIVDELLSAGMLFPLKERDYKGRRVLFNVARSVDHTTITNDDVMRTVLICVETLLESEESQIRGFTYISDYTDIGLANVLTWTPTTLHRAIIGIKRSLPIRHKQLHVFNLSNVMTTFMEMAKSFCDDKVQRKITINNDERSMEKVLPKNALPKEYGGTIPMQTMIDDWKKELLKSRERLIHLDTMKVSEEVTKKKAEEMYTVMGCEGSFRKIDAD